MSRESDLNEMLSAFPEWSVFNARGAVLKFLARTLEEGETVTEFLEGFATSDLVKAESPTGAHGVFFLTARRGLFLPLETNARSGFSFTLKELVGLTTEEGYLSPILTLTVARDGSTTQIRFSPISSGAAPARFLKALNRLMAFPGEEPPIEEELDALNFLFGEAKKIVLTLFDLMRKPDLASLGDDLWAGFLLLAGYCHAHMETMDERTKLFIALCLKPFYRSRDDAQKTIDELFGIDSFPLHKREALLRFYDRVRADLRRDKLPDGLPVLASLADCSRGAAVDYRLRYHYILLTFVQCLVKADGKVTDGEARIIKDVMGLLRLPENESAGNRRKAARTPSRKKEAAEAPAGTAGEEPAEKLEDILKELDSLIGMKNIKEQIATFVNLISVQKKREAEKLPVSALSLHAVFYGPPGTGKTTIARLLGRIYKSLGLLAKGQLVETDRAGLVAGYVGQTALKVDEAVTGALNGILFVDEAYSLIPENGTNDFGKEAVDCLIKRMEDNRDRLVVIVAGYPDEMKRFIESNPGFKSRFSRYFYFDHYTPDELCKIYNTFAGKMEYVIAPKAKEKLLALFTELYKERTRTFGNGRLARNIFEKTIELQANRLAPLTPLTKEILSRFEAEDIPPKAMIVPFI